MPEGITVKKVFKTIPEGKTSVGKPWQIWLDDFENYLKKKMLLEPGEKYVGVETPGN